MSLVPSPELCTSGRELGGPRRSPDGRWVAYVVAWAGRSALGVVPVGGGPERLISAGRPDDPQPQLGWGAAPFDWLPDGSAIAFAARDGNLWLQPFPGGRPRRLSDLPVGRSVGAPAVAPDGSAIACTVDLAEIRIIALDGSSVPGPSTEADFVVDPCWAPDGRLAWQQWSVPAMPWDHSTIGCWDPAEGTIGWLGSDAHQAQQPRFDASGRLWSLRDDRGWLNCWTDDRPAVDERFEHGNPTWGPGQRSFAVSPDGRQVAFNRNELGFGRLCVATPATGDVRELGRGVHTQLDWQGGVLTALRSGARTPTELVAYDVAGGTKTVLAHSAVLGWSAVELTEPEAVDWQAADGATVYGRLYRAARSEGRLLCWLHGGPTDQWQVGFLPRVAFWVGQGWSVLVPDFRGSTGHGRDYQQAMHGRWGELDTADVCAGLEAAAGRGWGTAQRTALVGGSAGGFTVLHVLAVAPERCAAAVVAYPVTDLIALDETTHRFEAHYNATLVGRRPANDQRYRDRSPIHLAARLTATPLLVTHGDADPVVGVEQSQQLVAAIVTAGGTAELHVYPGEGHGYRQPAHQLDEYARMAAFLTRHVP